MNEIKNYHPIVNFIYYVFVIGFSGFFMNPVCLVISLLSALSYTLVQKGFKELKTKLVYIVPVMLFTALINPAFNHRGITILGYFPNGNPLTFESCVYGAAASLMVAAVVCWFLSFNEIMTSDKLVYLFGKMTPSLSLVLSMTLRFIPQFRKQMKNTSAAQNSLRYGEKEKSTLQKLKNGITVLSAVITWSFENAIETAISMKSRGYGLPKRTAYTIFKFDKRDKITLVSVLFLGLYVFWGIISGEMSYSYYPVFSVSFSVYGISCYIAYAVLCIYPVIIECWEERRWNVLKSKI